MTSISVDDSQSIKWHVDAAFAVHKDFKKDYNEKEKFAKTYLFGYADFDGFFWTEH